MHGTANDETDLWRRLDWNDVRTFLAVAESGSLNGAARLLGMTQPTISRRMEDLEYRLGARLFQRSSKGVSLTDAGEILRDLAASMARFGESIVRNVSNKDKLLTGRVRISAHDGLAGYLMMPAMPAFQMNNPEIDLSVDCGLGQEAAFEGEADLTLTMSETGPADSVSVPIATLHYALFASQEYLRLYGTPKTLTEAAEHRWVRYTSHKEQTGTWHPKALAISELAGQQLISNSSAATLMAIKHGAGIGAVPTYALEFEPDLVMLDLEPMAHPLLYLRYRPSAERQGRIRRVKDWLINLFDPVERPWFREEFIHPRDFRRLAGRRTFAAKDVV
ncbi:MAG TPA: LysR family transcriptional regulator [Caulobacteraceae bacterium]|jgi:DNA-binding transcriptional LysR family regulator